MTKLLPCALVALILAAGQARAQLPALPASFTLTVGADPTERTAQATGTHGSYAMTMAGGKWVGSNGGNTVTITRVGNTYWLAIAGPSGTGGNSVLSSNGASVVWRVSVGSSGTMLARR